MSYMQQFEKKRYAQVPVEVLLDSRLTNSDKIAMIAILIYADVRTCTTTPLTLATLEEVTGLAEGTLSRSTTALVNAGYLEKKQSGYNEPNVYRILSPVYDKDSLRVITNKWVSDEEYAKKQVANAAKRENSILKLTNALGEDIEITWPEVKRLFGLGLKNGFKNIGIDANEFEKLGFTIVDRTQRSMFDRWKIGAR